MNDSDELKTDPFFVLHSVTPREGPGEPDDVAWACAAANTRPDARILDAACGPGADIAALLEAAPDGYVTAVDLHGSFVDRAQAAHAADRRVTVRRGDMATVEGPFDLIWCAGALYFLGVTNGLATWKTKLAPGGAVAFSGPCRLTDAPSERALALWNSEGSLTDREGVAAQVAAAGFETIATRVLSQAAWEAYYSPMEQRIATLRSDPFLADVIADAEEEIAVCRHHANEVGYLLSVVRPL